MSEIAFRVVFTGILREGENRREAISRLSNNFGLDFHQLRKLLSGGTTVVKSYANDSEARRLVSVFNRIGWEAKIVRSLKQRMPSATVSSVRDKAKKGIENVTRISRLSARDGSCTVQIPTRWRRMTNLNRHAVIQAGDCKANEFCVVLWKKVQNIGSNSLAKNYCGAQLQQCVNRVDDGRIIRCPVAFKHRGFNGFVGEISAKIESVEVNYLIACAVVNERVFTQFIWCEADQYKENRLQFLKMASTIEVQSEATPQHGGLGRMSRRRRRMRA
ncbi:hypothetical protein [Microbulbifer agarilyticus]